MRRERIHVPAQLPKERAPHLPDMVEEPRTRYDRHAERRATEDQIEEALRELDDEDEDS